MNVFNCMYHIMSQKITNVCQMRRHWFREGYLLGIWSEHDRRLDDKNTAQLFAIIFYSGMCGLG